MVYRIDSVELGMYKEQEKTSCTSMSIDWTDDISISITIFLVNSLGGTILLKSVNTSTIYKSGELFKLMDSMIQKVRKNNFT